MEKYFYLNSNNEQAGPVSPTDLNRYGITENTMVWRPGMPNWMRAGQIPELSQFLSSTTPPPIVNNNYGRQSYNNGNPYNGGSSMNDYSRPPKPDNGMVWGILTTIFCCLPFGVYSIVLASKVNNLYNNGCYDEAQRTAQKAKKWAGISAITGVIANIILYVLYVLMTMFVLSSEYYSE